MKQLTRDQVESRKEKAVRFVRDVVGDPGRADEIEDESLEDYAERRKFQITNPNLKRRTKMPSNSRTKADLEDENQELRDQLDAINDILNAGDDDDEDVDDPDDSDVEDDSDDDEDDDDLD
jgi:hypothetical protein